jgi:hypothetical protein
MLRVTKPFCGCGFNFPEVGTIINPATEAEAQHLIDIGAAEPYENKVAAPPKNIKKKKQSRSSQAGQARKKATRKKSGKSAKS